MHIAELALYVDGELVQRTPVIEAEMDPELRRKLRLATVKLPSLVTKEKNAPDE
jgi:hypothetical protein